MLVEERRQRYCNVDKCLHYFLEWLLLFLLHSFPKGILTYPESCSLTHHTWSFPAFHFHLYSFQWLAARHHIIIVTISLSQIFSLFFKKFGYLTLKAHHKIVETTIENLQNTDLKTDIYTCNLVLPHFHFGRNKITGYRFLHILYSLQAKVDIF